MKKRLLQLTNVLLLPVLFLLLMAMSFEGKAQTLTLDQADLDYSPGETVFFSGTGFGFNETVEFSIVHMEPFPNPLHPHDVWTTTTDENGSFASYWYVDIQELDTRLLLTAKGLTSGITKSVEFTDAGTTCTVSSISVAGCPQNITVCANASKNGVAGAYVNPDWTLPIFTVNSTGDCSISGEAFQMSFDLNEKQSTSADCWFYDGVQRIGTDGGKLKLWQSVGSLGNKICAVTSPFFYLPASAHTGNIKIYSTSAVTVKVSLAGTTNSTTYNLSGSTTLQTLPFSVTPATAGEYRLVFRFEYTGGGNPPNSSYVDLITLDANLAGNGCTGDVNYSESVTGINTDNFYPLGTTAITYTATYVGSSIITKTCTFNIIINPLPIALSLTGSTVCEGFSTTITSSTSVAGINYQLYNSANAAVGSPVAGTGSGLTWSGIGTGTGYYVKGTNEITGCVSANSNTVDVVVNPLPAALVLSGSTVCEGFSTTISSSTSVAGINYQLYNSANAAVGSPVAGTGSGLTWSEIPTGTGYYVKGTNANTGCVSAKSNEVNVSSNPLPTCQITVDGVVGTDYIISSEGAIGISPLKTITFCAPENMTYEWSGGFLTNDQKDDRCITVNDPGTYSVKITNSNGCSSTCSIVLQYLPQAGNCDLPATASVCPRSTTVYTASAVPIGFTYLWSVLNSDPDGSIPGSTSSQSASIVAGKTCGSSFSVILNIYNTTNHLAKTCQMDVSVDDNTAPTIGTQAANSTVECDGNGNTTAFNAWLAANGNATATDVCSSAIHWSNNYAAANWVADCGSARHVTVIFTAKDDCDNASTTSAIFTIVDETAPVLTAPVPLVLTCNQATDHSTAIAAWLKTVSVADDCDKNITITNDYTGYTQSCGNVVTVKFNAKDACNNAATEVSSTITFKDETAPVLTAPVPLVLTCNQATDHSTAIAAWLKTVSVADDCDKNITITNDYTGYTQSCGNVVTVKFNAKDACNNAATEVSSTITFKDETAPVLTAPVPLVLTCNQATDHSTAIAAWLKTVSVADDCDKNITITNDYTGYTQSCGNVVTVKFNAKDACNNAATEVSSTITFKDETAPVLTAPVPLVLTCNQATDHSTAIAAWLKTVSVADDCDKNITITNDYTGYTQSCGNVVTVKFNAKDACNNAATEVSSTITFKDETAPVLTAPVPLVLTCNQATDHSTAIAAWLKTVSVADDCDKNITITNDYTGYTQSCGNVVTVKFNAKDACNNAATEVSSTITFKDETAPVLTAPVPLVLTCNQATDHSTAIAAWLKTVSVADDCDKNITITNDYTGYTQSCGNVVTVKFNAKDACNNAATEVSSTITFKDETAPVLTAPVPLVLTCNQATDHSTAIAAWLKTVSVADDCDKNITITNDYTGYTQSCGNVVTVKFNAKDACNNAATEVSSTITFKDETAPVLTAPVPLVLTCNQATDHSTAIAAWLKTVSVADDCDKNITITNDYTGYTQSCGNVVTVKFNAKDACNNAATEVSSTITFKDETAPVLTAPVPLVLTCNQATDHSTAIAAWLKTVSVADDCDKNITITNDYTGYTQSCGNVVTVKFNAKDACNNAATEVSSTITFKDETAPVLTAPVPLVLTCNQATDHSTAIAAWLKTVSVADDCDKNITITNDYTGYTQSCGNVVTVKFNAKDACNNAATEVSSTITFKDETAPVLTAPVPLVLTCNQATDHSTAIAAWLKTVSVADDCDKNITITNDYTGYTQSCGNVVTVKFNAKDACNNAATEVSSTITFKDETAPVLTAPVPLVLTCNQATDHSTAIAAWLKTVSVADDCDKNITITNDYTGYTQSCGNVVTVKFNAKDACNNAATEVSSTITFKDETAPVLTAPVPLVLTCNQATDHSTAIAAWLKTVSVADDCDKNITITNDYTGYTQSCGNVVTVKFNAKDACNNAATEVSSTITFKDETAPVLTAPVPLVLTCNQATDHSTAIAAWLKTVSVADDCDKNITITNDYTGYTQSCGNVVTVKFNAKDACNNAATEVSSTITFKDETAPVLTAPVPLVLTCNQATDHSTAIAAWLKTVSVADDCDKNITITNDYTGYTQSCGNVVTVKFNAKDACNNAATEVSSTITFKDETAPVLTAPVPLVLTCNQATDHSTAIAAWLKTVSVADDCDKNITITNDYTGYTQSCGNVVTVKFNAKDACNNAATEVSSTITFKDETAPTFTSSIPCGSIYKVDYNPADCGVFVSYTISANDNCSGPVTPVKTAGLVSGSLFPIGETVVTYTATDDCENVATCSFTVKVKLAPTTSTLTVESVPTATDPGSQQYSDQVKLKVVITNAVGGSNCGNAATSATFTINGQVMRDPVTLITAIPFVANGSNLEAILTTPLLDYINNFGNGVMKPGIKEVSAVINGINNTLYDVAQPTPKYLTVTHEDAKVEYTGPEFVGEQNPNLSSTPVLLSASIIDVADTYRGDIRNAKVKFTDINGGDISGWLTPGLVNPGDPTQGIVTYMWDAPLPNTTGYNTFSIKVVVGTGDPDNAAGGEGYYVGAESSTLNVYRIDLNEFITGGGHIIPMDSKGEYASDPGRKVNFGYNVKWNKSVKNLQGNLNLIFRRGDQVYQIKSTAISSLSIDATNPCSQKATFISKANLSNVTDPIPVSIYGGLSLQVTMTDNGEPGVADMIGFTLFNGNTLVYSSSWPSTKTVELPLVGGNNVVHNGVICNASGKNMVLISSKNPSFVGEDVTFTANVGSTLDNPIATGTIQFKVDDIAYNSAVTMSNGSASITISDLPAGSHKITADYNGNYGTNSIFIAQTVNEVIASVTSSPNPSLANQEVTFTASVTGGIDGKTVTFKDGTVTLGTSVLTSAQAIFKTSTLSVGSHNITVVYDGKITSSVLVQVVNSGVSITLASSKNPSLVNEAVPFTANVTGGAEGGTVTFKEGITVIGTGLLASGSATMSPAYAFTTAGTHYITATYETTTSASFAQVVNSATAVILSSSANPSSETQQVTFTATVNGGSGSIKFFDGATLTATVSLSGGVATYSTSALSVGSHVIKAQYYNTSNELVSESSLTQVITTLSITLTSSKNPQLRNTNVTFTATVSGTGGFIPSGTITFKNGNAVIGSGAVTMSNGKASITTSFTTTGYYPISAVYNVTGLTSATLTQTISTTIKKVAEIAEIMEPVAVEPIIKAYPNPFTERLNIEFSSATEGLAKLEIFGVTGAKLATLFNGPVEAGVVYFNEYVPTMVSSQMVFYHLTIDGKTYVGKAVFQEKW